MLHFKLRIRIDDVNSKIIAKHKKVFIVAFLGVLLGGLFYHTNQTRLKNEQKENSSSCPECHSVIPLATIFLRHNEFPVHYKAYKISPINGKQQQVGIVYFTKDIVPSIVGYNGPINMIVGVDTKGTILGLQVLSHIETPEYVTELDKFIAQFPALGIQDTLRIGKNIDVMTEATQSSEAITRSISISLRIISDHVIKGIPVTESVKLKQYVSDIQPKPGIDVSKVKKRIEKANLKPQIARYWKEIKQ